MEYPLLIIASIAGIFLLAWLTSEEVKNCDKNDHEL